MISDDGSLNNSSIWNLTLTTGEINSEELKNKDIIEKVRILKEKSTIRENQILEQYISNGTFNFDKRKDYLLKMIFDEIFVFNPNEFCITQADVQRYRKIENILISQNDIELMDELKKDGKNFELKLASDPSLERLHDRWCSYITMTENG